MSRRRMLQTAVVVVLGLVMGSGLVGLRWSDGGDVPVPEIDEPAAAASPSATPSSTPSVRPKRPRVGPRPGSRPNIVLITTDDQTAAELQWMPRTRRLLGKGGTEFTDAVASHPLCCPARAEILTGEYAHNNGVRHNAGPYGGYGAFLDNNGDDHLGSWLRGAGYRTAFVGKTLNENVEDGRPMPGWDVWDPSMWRTYAYYGTTFYDNGSPETYWDTHVADVVRDKTVGLIEEYAEEREPFFIWASHVGPHDAFDLHGGWGPPVPAERHRHLFPDLQLPSLGSPSLPEHDLADKPGPARAGQAEKSLSELTELYRERVRSLQSIDEANAAVVRALRAAGELDDTLVVFASDNGFQLGEHGLVGKNLPYEETLRVPLLVRGPRVPAGRTTDAPARLVDLAPTFLQLAGQLDDVRSRGRVDGASLLPALDGRPLSDTTLIQAGTANPRALASFGWRWRGVRTARYTWVRWHNGRQELYDRQRDPHQLDNLVGPDGRMVNPAYKRIRNKLRRRYGELAGCSGVDDCQRRFGRLPPPE